ncbi:putative ATP-dependent RNA helicase dbp6 [Rosellinia necatrix]|uniref:ATP-dependent RNA helicase n=1 Tax=Rosellinia necatrix TaxID=77044 RepID=A0A1W2TID7_ROSNE|nr:putative ATP-dependent RNA helicase dbp6 [Rosellinia necatrix]
MYSRYIPPPREDSNHTILEPIASAQPLPIPPTTQPITYARYVPPPKPSRLTSPHVPPAQHVRFDDDDGANPEEPPAKRVKLREDDEDAVQTPDQSKAKRSKKKKLKTAAADSRDDSAVVVNGDVVGEAKTRTEVPEEPETGVQQASGGLLPQDKESSLSAEKPHEAEIGRRKDKKKKKVSKDDGDPPIQIEDDIPLRHKAILDKKAKYMQTASKPGLDDAALGGVSRKADDDASQQKEPEIELHGLEPIPQPKPVTLDTSTPLYETLPPWLASPIRISQDASAPFTDLGLNPDLGIAPAVVERLASKGYNQAFAIQTGVIPLLLPNHCKTMQGDVLVSAATGSGKTLAYTLPMIRDISQGSRHITRLRAIVVVPTRELVRQVQQVCEDCAGVFALDGAKRRPKIAMAMGSQSFEHEQACLVEREEMYDPEAYQRRVKRLSCLSGLGHESESDEDSGYNTEDEERDTIRRREDKLPTLPGHVIAYKSKVDILICTPGRLVEHIKFTPGFRLDFVRWLVVDEADKLLGQNFQQWLNVVIPRLHTHEQIGARNHKHSNLSGVRKIILSATMTRDLDQLEGLKLRRPRLVVLEGSQAQDETRDGANRTEHVLPELLEEAALKISDANLKPLFLVDLLRSHHILNKVGDTNGNGSDDDDTSSSGSDSDLDSDSGVASTRSKQVATPFENSTNAKGMPNVLIFTKSNETALRLSRLLGLLAPALEPFIGTLTSNTPYTTRRDTLRSFNTGKLQIIVASDLVARGIDLPSLDHVVNYDMPSSMASYVHRVGRTARAGNRGKAWTLFTNPEARWFWNEVASDKVIQRNKAVERVRTTEEKEEAFDGKVAAYEAALAKLGQEAEKGRHTG